MSRYDWYGWYPPSRPRRAEGGIRVSSRRGSIGETWWSGRWIGALESRGEEWSSRLQRGRRYARSGQVLDFRVSAGGLSARVQGSRREPYRVRVRLKPLDERQWIRVTRALEQRASYAASLLSGEMPRDIEKAFRKAGCSLFPGHREIRMSCTCPDWARPCKHVAAVFYVFAEALDRDPFLLFQVRGRSREEVVAPLRRRKPGGERLREARRRPEGAARPAEFWRAPKGLPEVPVSIAPPDVEMPLLRRLGAPPFCREEEFMERMEEAYATATRRAVGVAYRENGETGLPPARSSRALGNGVSPALTPPAGTRGPRGAPGPASPPSR